MSSLSIHLEGTWMFCSLSSAFDLTFLTEHLRQQITNINIIKVSYSSDNFGFLFICVHRNRAGLGKNSPGISGHPTIIGQNSADSLVKYMHIFVQVLKAMVKLNST